MQSYISPGCEASSGGLFWDAVVQVAEVVPTHPSSAAGGCKKTTAPEDRGGGESQSFAAET